MKETTGADFKSATDSENKKLFIETYGCQMNVADSEVIASIMQMAGYHVCETLDEADAVFMNTCSIRDNAEQKILNRLEFFHSMKKNKRRNLIVGVLGCMAERVKDDLIENHHVDLVVGPDAYLTLPDLVASVEAGEKAINVELSTTETYREVIPSRICGNHISGFVSIMRGCNNFCHYCIVPYTRGRERSRDVESILNEVRDLAVADKVWMLENTIYSILSPEGFATILWKDGSRSEEAAELMKITSGELLNMGIVDKVIPERGYFTSEIIEAIKTAIVDELAELSQLSTEDLLEARYQRFRKY